MDIKFMLQEILTANELVFTELMVNIGSNYHSIGRHLSFEDDIEIGLAIDSSIPFASRIDYAEAAVLNAHAKDKSELLKIIGEAWESVKQDKPKPSTVERACKMIQGRANVGQVKYGVSIDRNDLTASEWAQHALEEMLDGAQYLIRLKDEIEALQEENARLKLVNKELAG